MTTATTPLVDLFRERFGEPQGDLLSVTVPARSEIAGNHTDHEGGDVIGGALDANVQAVCAANGTSTVRVESVGYGGFEIDLADLAMQESERETTASLARGMAAELAATGREPRGFDLIMQSSIPAGSGLSSSAAVELAFGRAMEALWEGDAIDPVTLAKMAQRTENNYFGKPCGLLDQLAEALGGLAHMSFADPDTPATEKLALDFEEHGYALVLVNVGSDHSALTGEYAAVPGEMKAVAAAFGKERLCEVDPAAFDARVNVLRRELGDRPVLRALHYWYENELVAKRWAALQAGDIEEFLALTRASGSSSAMYLQNVSVGGAPEQPAMVALGLAQRLLENDGAVRIHGGGFGGSIQAFVPLDRVDAFCTGMDGWFGQGASRHYRIVSEGAGYQWL